MPESNSFFIFGRTNVKWKLLRVLKIFIIVLQGIFDASKNRTVVQTGVAKFLISTNLNR